jgi:hypothetical protein
MKEFLYSFANCLFSFFVESLLMAAEVEMCDTIGADRLKYSNSHASLMQSAIIFSNPLLSGAISELEHRTSYISRLGIAPHEDRWNVVSIPSTETHVGLSDRDRSPSANRIQASSNVPLFPVTPLHPFAVGDYISDSEFHNEFLRGIKSKL